MQLDVLILQAKKLHFTKVVGRPLPLLGAELMNTSAVMPNIYSKVTLYPYAYQNSIVISGDFYDDQDGIDAELKLLEAWQEKDSTYLAERIDAGEKSGKKLLTWCKKMARLDYTKFSDLELQKIFKDYVRISFRFYPYMIFTLTAGYFLEQKIKDVLQHKGLSE